jgi:hypothetical protein
MKPLQEMARELGRRGGLSRAARLTPERRRQIASLGGMAKALSRVAAGRILDNLRYLAAVEVLHGSASRAARGR